MIKRIKMTAIAALAVVTVALPGRVAAQNIVDVAAGNENFSTLAAALGAAGLIETLQGPGPFTVFAPTNAAFAKLPAGTVDALLLPQNRDQLIAILTYHVVSGSVPASTVVGLTGAETVNGQRVDIMVHDGSVMVDGATVTATDIMASNGIIHVIDEVIIPADLNIVETAQSAGTFQTLLAAATAAGFAGPLTGAGPLTVFAPTDAAFAELPEGTIDQLLAEEGMTTLKQILSYHVVEGRVYSDAAAAAGSAATLAGQNLTFSESMGSLKVNGVDIIAANLDASNGVIHVVNKVLMPATQR